MKRTIAAMVLVSLSSCDREEDDPYDAGRNGAVLQAAALLRDASGRELGRATLTEEGAGVRIRGDLQGLPPGTHGFHIHETAECHGPDFKSAGGHFNPSGRKHGLENPDGPHDGDLPNLVVEADGTARVDVLARGLTLGTGRTSLLGRSLMLHERPDDGKTDPDGAAGPRIACGSIENER